MYLRTGAMRAPEDKTAKPQTREVRVHQQPSPKGREPYVKPIIISVEKLEVIASVCDVTNSGKASIGPYDCKRIAS